MMDFSGRITEVANEKFAKRTTLTYKEAANVLSEVTGVKVSPNTIKLHVKKGTLDAVKVSTYHVVPVSSLAKIQFSAPSSRPSKAGRPKKEVAAASAK